MGDRIPHVRAACGERFFALFTAWAEGRPKVSTRADAEVFTAHLESIGELPAPTRRRLFSLRRN
ncbi:hypothetical protein [Rhodococcus opacus]|uniref:hypothetical protein n=1 Tax=Rhodococcus opacus TaxID=37919 RepID=UPI001E3CBADA|nr:hypothetical protein [Rhodococcus opacus]